MSRIVAALLPVAISVAAVVIILLLFVLLPVRN